MNIQDIQLSLRQKVLALEALKEQVRLWKAGGATIGFTNGVFDLIHIGHVNYLEEAASKVDHLILGLNSDSSVRRLGKGPDRPINPETERALVLAGLSSISAVCIFEEDTPLRLIKEILPDTLMKGGDYDPQSEDTADPKYIVGSKEVSANGGTTISIPFVQGYSTTDIVKKLSNGGKD